MKHQLINSRSTHYSGITYRGTAFDAHFHNSYELICVLKGNLAVTVNGQTVDLAESEFLLIAPSMVHSIGKSKAEFFIAIITPDYIPDFHENHKRNTACVFSVDSDAYQYVRSHLIEQKEQAKYQLKACLYILLSFVDETQGIVGKDNMNFSFIHTVNAYISEHFTERITRADLSKLTGYEQHYFSELFKANFGLNLCRYINSCRISHATNLLCTTDMKIGRIALESGFSSVKEFNNVFSQLMNTTPSQYRDHNPRPS